MQEGNGFFSSEVAEMLLFHLEKRRIEMDDTFSLAFYERWRSDLSDLTFRLTGYRGSRLTAAAPAAGAEPEQPAMAAAAAVRSAQPPQPPRKRAPTMAADAELDANAQLDADREAAARTMLLLLLFLLLLVLLLLLLPLVTALAAAPVARADVSPAAGAREPRDDPGGRPAGHGRRHARPLGTYIDHISIDKELCCLFLK